MSNNCCAASAPADGACSLFASGTWRQLAMQKSTRTQRNGRNLPAQRANDILRIERRLKLLNAPLDASLDTEPGRRLLCHPGTPVMAQWTMCVANPTMQKSTVNVKLGIIDVKFSSLRGVR
ncbi:hypothetical protein HBI56_227120 [Parastagonospora nodorum]|uniref:Uncharacterized protein n=1 Tax=Phaeosphaeria nodorum (strain SN15 / ATCC MYA-4574 / FGSC 10173) TaxID=321614 RepID=A0A7U2F158_PHANO|nr:hypothetical protein HBH56_244710 [Parastagonospora nodorum]QRC95688.1 hypothetical protein JI435_407810 [Parastagonospora nodorum SN15]KAH3921039.1 hypothetical protein HBH54_246510 [Parastagonospora nodorum]KAH3939496.1 hypothetical protein HBH53_234170 [Parastagonospora nodorum]KAH3959029.1 hypothetical protein HBH51_202290 [Parastagonospora nodorum]